MSGRIYAFADDILNPGRRRLLECLLWVDRKILLKER